tara:strand:- start:427 stop:4359 length:3933 start_codon:yes stop_codon:yes gene_type:complete
MEKFKPLRDKLIYVFRINDTAHLGCLKVGEATVHNLNNENLLPNCKTLNDAAKKRINQYTQTAGISYNLLHTELAQFKDEDIMSGFSDKKVHRVLTRSGINKKVFDLENKANEWFLTDLETVKKAISAVKNKQESLNKSEISNDINPVIFRPEQKDAIARTIKQFKKNNEMLWFAKMRFGKTLTALQVIKEHNFNRTLILTHRPVVNAGWYEDFSKIFYDSPNFFYGSKEKGETFKSLDNREKREKINYIFFASMQDLRGSELVGGNFDKNNSLFNTDWNFIVIDEAHEGTQTNLGKNVLLELKNTETKILHLSGTPFNLIDNYKEDEIYTWDYVMEQKAKSDWDEIHFGDPNPYASLPKMNIYTYDIGNEIENFVDEDIAFNFREFFRTDENIEFIYKKDVLAFLNLITKEDSNNNYPFSTQEYRDNFRHSLWIIPGVKEARALSSLMKSHPVFSHFNIINVAGDGDDDDEVNDEALKKVEKAITNKPHETLTITLSCGRLTTGVSVKAWTAVFMLSGSYNSSASSYMQTIFRVQTPATINGKIKEECFVFDFAPDRTLKVIAETAKMSAKAGKTTERDRQIMGDFLNFCPIISASGTQMKEYNVNSMLEQLKKVYIERVVRNGFEDSHLYNNDELMKLESVELEEFIALKKIIGSTKAMHNSSEIDINKQGFSDEEYEKLEQIKKKKKKDLTPEEKKLLEERKEKKKNRDTAVSILRGISIRMPLLIYGADIKNEDEELNINNFVDLVDNKSWKEFMPKDVTKNVFKKFKKYYEPDVFRAAGKRIRSLARATDKLTVEDRIERITSIFGRFKNPDKETVLTPWRVVNMQIGNTLGGYVFFDEKFKNIISNPRFIEKEKITENVFDIESNVLEINSKSGLYPLLISYNIYRASIDSLFHNKQYNELTISEQHDVWDKVVSKNIFVICKTPMAKSITKRTLIGFKNKSVNTRYFEDLENQITNKKTNFIEKIKKGNSYWKANNNNDMKFKAIVGNPPYQVMDGGNSVSARPIYHQFVEISKEAKPDYISLIMPARWYAGGKGLDDFRTVMLNDNRISHLFDYPKSTDCFESVDIAGGLCYFLWDINYKGKTSVTNYINDELITTKRKLNEFDILVRDNKAVSITKKIQDINKAGKSLASRVSSRKPFGLPTNYIPKNQGIPCWFIQKIGLKYAGKEDVIDTNNYLDKWKLLLPPTPIAGQTDFTKPVGFYYDGNTVIAKPGECCTESFIIAAAFDTKEEILSFKSFLFTKVVRFLLLQRVISQHVTKKVFEFIPDLVNYKGTYNDYDLCKLWNISDEEWKYIDSRIKNIN